MERAILRGVMGDRKRASGKEKRTEMNGREGRRRKIREW